MTSKWNAQAGKGEQVVIDTKVRERSKGGPPRELLDKGRNENFYFLNNVVYET